MVLDLHRSGFRHRLERGGLCHASDEDRVYAAGQKQVISVAAASIEAGADSGPWEPGREISIVSPNFPNWSHPSWRCSPRAAWRGTNRSTCRSLRRCRT